MDSKKFLTVEEVAAEFGLDAATLQQFVDAGDVRALADRGTWKYRRDELQSLVDAGRIALPAAELWTDEAAASENAVLTVGQSADDDQSYIELDEEALAEHATMITKSHPTEDRTPVDVDEIGGGEDWFVPSAAQEMALAATDPQQSSSDVQVLPDVVESGSVFDMDEVSSAADSDSDVRLAGSASRLASDDVPASLRPDSDSDVRIADDIPAVGPDGSGIVLDFDVGAGATVSSSGSSLRLPQTATADDPFAMTVNADADELAMNALQDEPVASASGDSGISLENVLSSTAGDSSLAVGEDSGLRLFGLEESGIALDGGSHVGMGSAGSSVISGAGSGIEGVADDSGLALDADEDSGLSLEAMADSGISLHTAASGASATEEDSGLTLSPADSGLSLEAADSGLSLDAAGDSGIAISPMDKTLADDDLAATMLFDQDEGGKTQTLDLANDFDDDSSFDMNLSDSNQTSELMIDDDEVDELAPTVVKKGRGKASPGLTEAFQLDDEQQVEDLDISEDLDAGVDDELEAVADVEEEEVFEASDETFSDELEATDDDEDYLDAAAGTAAALAAAKALGPREPSWGMGMSIGLIACSLILAANALVLWAGVSTMWNGAEAPGPAAAIIAQLAGLISA